MDIAVNEKLYDQIWLYVEEHSDENSTAVGMFDEIKKTLYCSSMDVSAIVIRDLFECIESALKYSKETKIYNVKKKRET